MAPLGETSRLAWAPGPSEPLLAAGEVHVWRASLKEVADDLGGLLSAEEAARSERFLQRRDGRLWRRSRGLLRVLLGSYLQRDPSTLRFATGRCGKPALLEDEDPSQPAVPPCFNMSHSGGLALYAFSRGGPVGVDVEVAGRAGNEVAIAARLFGEAEARRLEALGETDREREFLRAWVRHEAEVKLLGSGIGGPAGGRDVWISELPVGPRAAGAIALESPPRELCCWDWRQRV